MFLRNHDGGFEDGRMTLEVENIRNEARSEIEQRNQFSRASVGTQHYQCHDPSPVTDLLDFVPPERKLF